MAGLLINFFVQMIKEMFFALSRCKWVHCVYFRIEFALCIEFSQNFRHAKLIGKTFAVKKKAADSIKMHI